MLGTRMSHASNFSIANSLRSVGVSLCVLLLASSISLAIEAASESTSESAVSESSAAPDADGLVFFENKIRPVLIQHCYKCHAADAKSVKGSLLLDTKHGVLSGGDSGASVVPGSPDDSPLLSALRYDDYEMPPSGQLPDSVVADFEKWIRMGAPDPREDGQVEVQRREIDIAAGRAF
ncbi:MAG: c-type cytochrome domain-containing protein, partial [Rubripirellula sp.]